MIDKMVVEDIDLEPYFKSLKGYAVLSREEEAELCRRIRKGDDEALESLVNSNLRFVISVAKRYRSKGLPFADLISEGNLGLIEAAKRFDETKGYRFISYAVWWIRQSILLALSKKSRIVTPPINHVDDLQRLGRERDALSQKLGREPTYEEILSESGISRKRTEKTISLAKKNLSLEKSISKDGGFSLSDIIMDDDPPIDEVFISNELRNLIEKSLGDLDPRQADILALHFGIGGEEPKSLSEIGRKYGITKERIRQLKNKALKKIREGKTAKALEPFLN